MKNSISPQALGLALLSLVTYAAAVPFGDEKLVARQAVSSSVPVQTSSAAIPASSGASSGVAPVPVSSGASSIPSPPPGWTSVVSDQVRPSSDTRSGPPSTVTIARAAMTPYIYNCNKTEKAIVQTAWSEAGTLADAHAKWKPPGWFNSGAFQPAMDMYLGTDSSKDDPWFGTGPLKQNINRQQGIHTTNEDWSPYWSYVYVYCDESKVPSKPEKPKTPQCNSPNTPGKGVMAYTFPDDGTIFGWNAKYVVFCPRFFQTDILSLDAATTAAKANKTMQGVMDPWRKVHARSFFHETYHWGPAEVSDPIANRKPEIYDPAAVVALASKENIAGSKINAESWAQAAMAIYIQDTFSLKTPPVPESSAVTDDFEEIFFDTAPDWFQSPVSLDDPVGPISAAPESSSAMPTCSLQNEDPDQGINARGCVCGSTTLPLLTITPQVPVTSSCSYTAMPTASATNPITIGTQTYTQGCQACTLVGGIADTPSCTSISGCTPPPTTAPAQSSSTPPAAAPTSSKAPDKPCNDGWCGAPFCSPECEP